MYAKSLIFVELGVEVGCRLAVIVDSAERQPRGNRGIVVHRCESLRARKTSQSLASHW
jgi:hypothetical protein